MAKNRQTKKAQSDNEAEEIVSELEGMVAQPPRKSGPARVQERSEEVRDAAGRPPVVFGPAGPTTEGRKLPTPGVFGPGGAKPKRLNEEFLDRKSKADEGGIEPAATPTGFSEPPRPSGGVALPDATKARRRMEGGK